MRITFLSLAIICCITSNSLTQCSMCPNGSVTITGSTIINEQNNATDFCIEGNWTGTINNIASGSTVTICDDAIWDIPGNLTIQSNVTINNFGEITDSGNDYKILLNGQPTLNNELGGTITVGQFENQDATFVNNGDLIAEDLYLHGAVTNNGNITSTADCGGSASTTCGFFVGDKANPMVNYGTINFVDGVLKESVIGGSGTFMSTGTLIIENNNGNTDINFIANNLTFQNTQNVSEGNFTISGIFNCNNATFTSDACFSGGSQGSQCSNSSDPIIQCSILPVIIIDFTFKRNNEMVSIIWEVETEINVSHYELLYSLDGIDFNVLETIDATNRSLYQYDTKQFNADKTYIKLKSIDLDGSSSTYSNILLLKNNQVSFKVGPNPTSAEDGLVITSLEVEDWIVSIIDLQGKRLSTNIISGTKSANIDLNNLEKSGLYIVEISSKYMTFTEKIIVHK